MGTEREAPKVGLEAIVGPALPMWWDDYLTLIERAFLPGADADNVKRAKDEMTAAARAAVADHHRFLACLGMRQPGEQAPFEAWASASGYDTRCIGPRYSSQRTKDAERGWMARGHSALPPNAQVNARDD